MKLQLIDEGGYRTKLFHFVGTANLLMLLLNMRVATGFSPLTLLLGFIQV